MVKLQFLVLIYMYIYMRVMWYMHTVKFSFSQLSFLGFFCLCQSSPKQNFRIINTIWHMLECYKDHIVEYVFLLFPPGQEYPACHQ